MTAAVAHQLALHGWNSWNIEYRRGSGVDAVTILSDCARAVDYLSALQVRYSLDLTRVIALGHSAGGHLAAWYAGRRAAAKRDGLAVPELSLGGVISVAGVLDLRHAAATHVGDDAVPELLGGPPESAPREYDLADPITRLPTGITTYCLHSKTDTRVPFDQSERYVAAARSAGDPAELGEIPGDHTDVLDPDSKAWPVVLRCVGQFSS